MATSDKLTPEDIDEIEARAKAATPGPYEACFDGHGGHDVWIESRGIADGAPDVVADFSQPNIDQRRADARYAARMCPATTLALLAALRAAEARAEAAE